MTRPSLLLAAGAVVFAVACGSTPPPPPIIVDGSSTVFPLSQRAADEFRKRHRTQEFQIRFSSTGEGLSAFCAGTLDIANASRPITADEHEACTKAGVTFLEVPIAYDAITVVVNATNTWVESMTVPELKALWEPAAQGKVVRWNEIRKEWPDREVHLVGPDPASGTFDYFTEAIVGTAKASRTDYQSSSDDEALAKAVAGDELALGYFGLTYFSNHKDTLKAVAIDDLDVRIAPGPIAPSSDTVRRGMYRPLSRPLFLYVKATSLERTEVQDFLLHFPRNSEPMAAAVGGVSLGFRANQLAEERILAKTLGTLWVPRPDPGLSLERLLSGDR